ncbi:hypothetical protein J2795_004114 [Chryseobacterium bernardetii]|uniref:Uncharacterized protein n=2 Tax=Chryseobacterium TaxID=59732 RepID=A0A543EH35_9FLAO|nr:hypothetical protein [Chryseobacterium vietnamense]MDR6443364.1 hypothetical protein [Chryseobacterium bernardetii]TQM20809.1 hypothetical protein FB551_0485 [Chryseobacterium aquifrigidense]
MNFIYEFFMKKLSICYKIKNKDIYTYDFR